jgi:hypothetical protein
MLDEMHGLMRILLIKLLNASSRLLQYDPFDVVSEIGSLVPFFNPLTRKSNYVHVSTTLLTFKLTSRHSISISTILSTEITSNLCSNLLQ